MIGLVRRLNEISRLVKRSVASSRVPSFFFLPGSTEFQQPLVVSAVVLAYIRFYWVLPSFTRFQTVFSDFFFGIAPNLAVSKSTFSVMMECTGLYWVFTEFQRPTSSCRL